MSNQDYYGSQPRQHQYQPYTSEYGAPTNSVPLYESRAPSVAPSYHTQAPYNPPNRGDSVSPFESTFDDHVYPARPGFNHADSTNSFGSTIYGQGPRADDRSYRDDNGSYRDDIPLRSTASQKDAVDHVYDVQPSAEERRPRKGLGFLKGKNGRIPWVVYCLTTIQVAVFIAEIVKMGVLTGSPIQTQPSFNPMIGPSPYVLINMGARYVTCMHNVDQVQNSDVTISWPCPNSTTLLASDGSNQCTLSQLCGFNGVPNPVAGGSLDDKPEPNQWFRFILPIFLHAGLVHIGFNMLLQMTMGREMEVAIGSIRFFLVYMASGIFGFVMGGNFAATGIASTGASGSLFGIIALTLLDLLYTWNSRPSSWKDFAFIVLDIVISFVLGLLPGLDNFSHIGGFLMGIVLGICILHSPAALQERISDTPYNPVDKASGMKSFTQNPVGFFKGRKPAWWAWWGVRAASLVAVFIVFILLLNNFYVYRKTCGWCKYLSCLDVTVGGTNWCSIGQLNFTSTTSSKRDLFAAGMAVFEGLA